MIGSAKGENFTARGNWQWYVMIGWIRTRWAGPSRRRLTSPAATWRDPTTLVVVVMYRVRVAGART